MCNACIDKYRSFALQINNKNKIYDIGGLNPIQINKIHIYWTVSIYL